MLYCIFSPLYTSLSYFCQPLLRELDSIDSVSSLLFPSQDWLQYLQLLPVLWCWFFVWSVVVIVFYNAQIALISSKYKPRCHTFISDLLCKLMGKSASSADFWACSEKKMVVIFLFSQYSPRNSFVNAASECPLTRKVEKSNPKCWTYYRYHPLDGY